MGASHTTVQRTTFANRLQKCVGHPIVTVFPICDRKRVPADAAAQEKYKGGDRR